MSHPFERTKNHSTYHPHHNSILYSLSVFTFLSNNSSKVYSYCCCFTSLKRYHLFLPDITFLFILNHSIRDLAHDFTVFEYQFYDQCQDIVQPSV